MARGIVIGCWLELPSPGAAEIVGGAGSACALDASPTAARRKRAR